VDTVHTADGAIIISGPGNVTAYASGRLDATKWEPPDLPDELVAFYSFMPIAFEAPVAFRVVLWRAAEEDPTKTIAWNLADDEVGRFAVD
jgi:hypothetical protein